MSTYLFRAVNAGDLAKVKSRLAGGDDPDWVHKGTGRTALLEAVIQGSIPMIDTILDAGADVHFVGKNQDSALSWALEGGDDEVISHLLARGAHSEDLRDSRGAHSEAHVTAPEVTPWPDLAWDPRAVADGTQTLPESATPFQVLRSYLLASFAVESAYAEHTPTDDSDLLDALEAAVAALGDVRDTHATPRERAYERSGVSNPPEFKDSDVVIAHTQVRPDRVELVTRDSTGENLAHGREWRWVLLRHAQRWRIDSVASRSIGTEAWISDTL